MDNSNTTASINTSKSTNTPKFIPAASQTTFDIGDVVLCPSLSSSPFVLTDDPYGKRDLLALTHDGSYHYYDVQGYFVKASDTETGDYQPSLYHNTPANQQAINTLYGNAPTALSTFKVGNAVLCPRFGSESYQLFIDDEDGFLSFIVGVNKFHTRADGKLTPNDKSPSIFHDTPSNRQIITALYDQAAPTLSQRAVIDTTEADDKEAVLLSAFDLRDIACDIEGAITTLNSIGLLLHMIYQENITHKQALSMARLSHDSTDRWADLLCCRLNTINAPLTKIGFGTEVAA